MSINKRVVGSVVGHLAQRQLAIGNLRGVDDLGHIMLRAMVDVLLLHVQPQEFVSELKAAFPNTVGS